MDVVMIFKYGKRFRFAPSFNKNWPHLGNGHGISDEAHFCFLRPNHCAIPPTDGTE